MDKTDPLWVNQQKILDELIKKELTALASRVRIAQKELNYVKDKLDEMDRFSSE